jgi:predicted ATPase
MSPTRGAVTGNLPAELSSFVGRGWELDEVRRLLSESRLVTLTGMGGTGKTRLAVRLAGQLRRAFPDGVWFVDLAELNMSGLLVQELQDPDVLAFLLMGTLGLREQSGDTPVQSLVGQLAERRVLLVLDNCEHLLPACAVLVEGLLRNCPGLRVLATSRELLGIGAEVLFAVPPLSAPQPGHRLSSAQLGRYESVMLFVARAEASVPGFTLGPDNHDAVAEAAADSRPAERPVRSADSRTTQRAGPAADPAGLSGLVLRSLWEAGAAVVGAAVGVCRQLRPGGGRACLCRRAAARGRRPRFGGRAG